MREGNDNPKTAVDPEEEVRNFVLTHIPDPSRRHILSNGIKMIYSFQLTFHNVIQLSEHGGWVGGWVGLGISEMILFRNYIYHG